jgi:hypothetical protein
MVMAVGAVQALRTIESATKKVNRYCVIFMLFFPKHYHKFWWLF